MTVVEEKAVSVQNNKDNTKKHNASVPTTRPDSPPQQEESELSDDYSEDSESSSYQLQKFRGRFVPTKVNNFLLSLLNNPNERPFLVYVESKIIPYIRNKRQFRLDFPNKTTYQRMVIHKMAPYYKLNHYHDGTINGVYLLKTVLTEIPLLLLAEVEVENPGQNNDKNDPDFKRNHNYQRGGHPNYVNDMNPQSLYEPDGDLRHRNNPQIHSNETPSKPHHPTFVQNNSNHGHNHPMYNGDVQAHNHYTNDTPNHNGGHPVYPSEGNPINQNSPVYMNSVPSLPHDHLGYQNNSTGLASESNQSFSEVSTLSPEQRPIHLDQNDIVQKNKAELVKYLLKTTSLLEYCYKNKDEYNDVLALINKTSHLNLNEEESPIPKNDHLPVVDPLPTKTKNNAQETVSGENKMAQQIHQNARHESGPTNSEIAQIIKNQIQPQQPQQQPQPHVNSEYPYYPGRELPPQIRPDLAPPMKNHNPHHMPLPMRNDVPPLMRDMPPLVREDMTPYRNDMPPFNRGDIHHPIRGDMHNFMRHEMQAPMRNSMPPHMMYDVPPNPRHDYYPSMHNDIPPHMRYDMPSGMRYDGPNSMPPHLRGNMGPPMVNDVHNANYYDRPRYDYRNEPVYPNSYHYDRYDNPYNRVDVSDYRYHHPEYRQDGIVYNSSLNKNINNMHDKYFWTHQNKKFTNKDPYAGIKKFTHGSDFPDVDGIIPIPQKQSKKASKKNKADKETKQTKDLKSGANDIYPGDKTISPGDHENSQNDITSLKSEGPEAQVETSEDSPVDKTIKKSSKKKVAKLDDANEPETLRRDSDATETQTTVDVSAA